MPGIRSSCVIVSWFITFLLILPGTALAGSKASQKLFFRIHAITEIEVPPEVNFDVDVGVRDVNQTEVSSYSMSTNETNKKITAQILEPLPLGIKLYIAMKVDRLGTELGEQDLSSGQVRDCVTGISKKAVTNGEVSYRIAVPRGTPSMEFERTVVFTVVDQ